MDVVNLILIFALISISAIFVAAEFSFIRIRASKVEQLIIEGNKSAISVQRILGNLDGYLSACQLGITVTSLALGFLGEPTVASILDPIFEKFHVPTALSHSIAITIAFLAITFFHVVLGELAPKTIAIQKAEVISLFLAKPMIFFYVIMYPFIWVLNGSAVMFVKLFGLKNAKEHEEVHSEEELRILLSESYQSGEINQSEYKYVNRIFNFDELTAREIMIPRVDLIALDVNASTEENIKIMKEEQYTRFPVVEDDKDHIIGFIHSKEFFMELYENKNVNIKSLIRPVLTVPDSIAVKDLLRKMQADAIHFAILTEEYGGTSGLVTLEDILEEIVGDIRDEFDSEEIPDVEKINDNEYIFDGKVLINEVNELLGTDLNSEEADTIGGYLYFCNSELKEKNQHEIDDLLFTVLEGDSNRYKRIKIFKTEEAKEKEEV